MNADSSHQKQVLIGSGDPPPFSVINERGTGKVLLTGDHASNAIPRSMNNLGLEKCVLQQHVAYDIGTRKLIHQLARQLDAPAVLAGYSRLIVDLNRNPEDPTLIPEESDHIVIPGNQNLTREQRAQRVETFYNPYRIAIDNLLDRFRSTGVVPALISIHSFTPEMAGVARPWHVGLMWDADPRIPLPLLERLRAHPEELTIGDNLPYSGKHSADYTIDHHAETCGLPHVSIEIRQDMITSESGVRRWAVILNEALDDILADPGLYRIWEG